MPIPLVQIPGLTGTRLNMTTPSAGALGATGAALGDVAQGIAAVGGALGKHADRVQSMENAYQESEARQGIAKEMSDLDIALATNNDPSSYKAALEKTLQRTEQYTNSENLSPLVRQRMQLYHGDVAAQAQIKIAERAASMTAKRASLALSNELETAMTHGDEAAFRSAGGRLVEGGLMLPEQLDAAQQKFNQAKAFGDVRKEIEFDPQSAKEKLDSDAYQEQYPDLTPEDVDRLKRYAEQKQNSNTSDNWEAITEASINGTILTKEDIKTMMAEGDLTPAQAGSYINAYHGATQPAFDPVLFDKAHKAIASYDPAKDPSGAVRAQLSAALGTLALPKESITELSKQLRAQINPSAEDAPNKNLQSEYNKRLEIEWDSEAFGKWFKDEETEFLSEDGTKKFRSRKVISQKEFGAALAFKTKTRTAFNAWLASQPEGVDPMEAEKKYNEIKGKALDGISMPDVSENALPFETYGDVDEFTGETPPSPAEDAASRTSVDGTVSEPLPPTPVEKKTSKISTFGGQPIYPPGVFYRRAATSVFGGSNDPLDNGLSASGRGGNNDFAGVAIPEDMLKATFPGKSKEWFFDNVKVVVQADNGRQVVLPLADYGTAEWVTKREGRHKLDLNEKAVRALGGQVIYKDGKMKDHAGFRNVNFSLSTAKAGKMDPKTSSIDDLQNEWFKDKRPRHPDQIESGLSALYDEFYSQQSI